ncbi:hypothetical protein DCC85_17310 [Paenibacillus sp. CAA11]|uniref:hypothetical protein n=1 Tax=Paenibacillus sp. CAA11 TaxID=1532905 RepID=UPI000D3B4329|nr:hypothetical protein [Paenibacillus sp. CAA11]AWB45772.1 hypothetical protein DCC85_17310 [Paenibacillus sp. CAA11]
MEQVKISQHTAILLEHARKSGIGQTELLQAVKSKDLSAFAAAEEEHYAYGELFTYAEQHGEQLEQAVLEGYRITFNTRNGLKIWLEEAFHLHSETDFEVGDGRIEGVRLTEEQYAKLQNSLAANWAIAETKEIPSGIEVTLSIRALL